MNKSEVNDVKQTWEMLADDPTKAGVAILLNFFTKYPANKSKFKLFEDKTLDELKDNARFKLHAGRIMNVFEQTVKALDHEYPLSEIERIWTQIAETHFTRKIEKQSFEELKEVILETLVPACNLNEHQIATWTKVMELINNIIYKTLDRLYGDQ